MCTLSSVLVSLRKAIQKDFDSIPSKLRFISITGIPWSHELVLGVSSFAQLGESMISIVATTQKLLFTFWITHFCIIYAYFIHVI